MEASKGQAESGLDIIEASYRLVADASAFDDVIATWADRIDQVDSRQIAQLDHPLLVRHLSAVGKLFDAAEPSDDEAVTLAMIAIAGPAVVLSSDCRVVAANPAASVRWDLTPGRGTTYDWLDANSIDSFEAVRRSASDAGPGRHAILRTVESRTSSCLAECFIIEPLQGGAGYIAIRSLDLGWSEEVAATLSQVFGLTAAEIEICRLLLDTRDTAQIAELRSTSVLTVRTQLRTVFSKTETATQVDLIRLIAMLCARSRASITNTSKAWIDPLGREEIFEDAHGRAIAYSWLGDEAGRPALLVHGMATGYVLPAQGIAALHEHGIKLYAISRPGFGNSDQADSSDPMHVAATAICALAGHLGIETWPAIGLSAGFPPLVHAAADPSSKIERLLGVAAYLPFAPGERFENFPPVRKIAFRLVRSSRHMADLVGQFSYRMTKSRKFGFLRDYMYSDCAADRKVLQQPEFVHIIDLAREFMITQGHHAVASDLRIMADDWSYRLKHCGVPIHLMHGIDDPVVDIAQVRLLALSHAGITVEEFPDSGELLFCDHSPAIIAALAKMS